MYCHAHITWKDAHTSAGRDQLCRFSPSLSLYVSLYLSPLPLALYITAPYLCKFRSVVSTVVRGLRVFAHHVISLTLEDDIIRRDLLPRLFQPLRYYP